MIKIGVTGCDGFFGKNLISFFNDSKEFSIIGINKEDFNNDYKLNIFLENIDVLVHLAGVNRHEDKDKIYNINIDITKRLIQFLENKNIQHLIFSSSIQEKLDNKYGLSKKYSREMLSKFCSENNIKFTGLILPNTFGPYGKPFYNSVISTFCYQVVNSENPSIIDDKIIDFIYIIDICEIIKNIIKIDFSNENMAINGTFRVSISEVLRLIKSYNQKSYKPQLNRFEQDLLNTFRYYER